jgi:hypothetical protein
MWDKKDEFETMIAQEITDVADILKDPIYPELMEGTGSIGQQAVTEELQGGEPTPYDFTWNEWQQVLDSPPLERLVLDFVNDGDKLSAAALDQIEYLAGGLDIDPDIMLELIEQSLAQE